MAKWLLGFKRSDSKRGEMKMAAKKSRKKLKRGKKLPATKPLTATGAET
jgi:hypothetical protein